MKNGMLAGNFDGMGKGVAQIEESPVAVIERVFLNDVDFDLDGPGHDGLKYRKLWEKLPGFTG